MSETDQERMIEEQLAARGIADPRVLAAFRRLSRDQFVSEEYRDRAFDDRPLPIGYEQTISQPYMVACMTEALQVREGQRVLEIGTGSGYQTAILAELGARVFTIERLEELSRDARHRLARYPGISFRVGDGTLGWPEEAPFDRILVTAGAPSLPIPLVQQMADGGRMVIPVGDETQQELLLVTREGGRVNRRRLCGCIFVKLVGKEGW